MTRDAVALLVSLPLVACSGERPVSERPPGDRPNVLIIVADDLGYSDLGFLGGEVRTPRLDALAASGVVLSNFHVAPACSPTRAMLLSGVDAHVAGLGSMSGEGDPRQYGQPGYEGFMTDRVVTVASLLRDAGYATVMAGKWHLGDWEPLLPHNRGFERSFVLPGAGASHFSDARQLSDTPVPVQYLEDGRPVPLPSDFYSSDFYTDRLIRYLDEAAREGRPFFAYAAYTAPHWPLQAKDDDIDLYRGVYDDGWDVLRTRRVAGLVEAGVVPPEAAAPDRLSFVPAWDDLSPGERRVQARKMEVYAAMVENLDTKIGRLLDHVGHMGADQRTLVLFFSDNGAEGNPIEDADWTWKGGDNRLSSIGRPGSYVSCGPGWAQASTAPFRLFKAFPTEGGVRVPAIVVLPEGPRQGTRDEAFASVKDVVPTVLEFAGVEPPGRSYQGRPIAQLEGTSMLPFLRGEAPTVHPPDHVMAWELFGRRAVMQGRWKLLWLWEPYGPERWELYDVARDPGESRDLSAEHPEKGEALLALWSEYARRNAVILPSVDTAYALETAAP